jgi:saccharopine dehydrogenase (NAD+, L-glutamate forming)
MAAEREHDVVVFGATGFTGKLTAQYLVRNAPAGTRLALAGRSREKLERTRDELGRGDLPLLSADVEDEESLRAMAGSARIVVTTVGPYITYGEPLVKACAEAGTDYVDLTGEPEFVDLMYLRHHERATETGARLVHACGFDSIPHDLGALFTVQQLPEGVPIEVEGIVRAGGRPSGGTFASAVTGFSRARETVKTAKRRRRAEPRPEGRRVHGRSPRPRRDSELGVWLLPFPSIDPQIIQRSARALDRYGPDFGYAHYIGVKRLPAAAGIVCGVGTVFALSQLPPTRRLMLDRLPAGQGPSEEQMEKGWFKVRFRGSGGGQRVVCEVSGGDPGYRETSKMLAESALCLAHDDLPRTAGQVTTAQAMGDALIARLQRAGISFRVVEDGGA